VGVRLTEFDVQMCFYRLHSHRYKILIPNYTPVRWFECDLLGITKADCAHEYEIKLTKADLKNDWNKTDWEYRHRGHKWRKENTGSKMEMLAAGDERGPIEFSYILPKGMVEPGEVPDFAGIYEVNNENQTLLMHQVRQAKRLHKKNVAEAVKAHIYSVFPYRFWNERLRRWKGE